MRADHLRPGDVVVLAGAQVESVLVADGSVFVFYADPDRPGELFAADAQLVVAREEEE